METVNLSKGQVLDLKKADGSDLVLPTVGLSWDVNPSVTADLDLFIVQKLANGQKTVAYFGKKDAIEGVQLSDDNLTGEGDGDDEWAKFDAKKTVDSELYICVNIYTPGVTFKDVSNEKAIVRDENNNEIAKFEMGGEGDSHNAIIVGKLIDAGDSYKFEAIGEYKTGDINQIANAL